MTLKTTKKKSITILILLISVFFSFLSHLLISDVNYTISFSNTKEVLGSIVMFVFALGIAYNQFKIPSIEINRKKIIFKSIFRKKKYLLSDIKNIELADKMPYKWMFIRIPAEGMFLEFKNNEIEYIYDDFYTNLWEIKTFLNQQINKSKNDRFKKTKSYFRNSIIKGSFLTTYSIIVISLIVFVIFLLIKIDYSNLEFGALIVISIFILLIASFGNLLYYFDFNSNKLIVRNHLFFWFKKHYNASNIKEIVIENPSYRTPDGLRVISNNFQTKLYMSGSYKEKDWINIINIINESNIELRNESLWYLEKDKNN